MNIETQASRSDPRLDAFDACWAMAALFGVLVSVLIAVAFTLLRLGLQTPSLLAPGCLAVLAASALAPLLLPRRSALADASVRTTLYPIVSLLVLASVLLAFLLGKSLLLLYSLLAVAGAARAVSALRRTSGGAWLVFLAGACATAAYLFVTIGNLGYAGVYTPEQGLLGLLNHDTRFHTAVSFLISNFGTPSLGVDGMLPLKYHFGSHAWFAALGRLTGAEPLWSYGAGVLITAVPMLLLSLLFSGLAIDGGRKTPAAYLVLGVSLLLLSDAIGWQSYYISETYTFGLIGLLLFMPLLASLARTDGAPAGAWELALGVIAIPLLMSLKVSVGAVWAVAFGWTVSRRHGLRAMTFVLAGACVAMLLVGLGAFSPGVGDYVYTNGKLIAPLYFVRAFPEVKASFSSFVFPACLTLLAFSDASAAGLRSVKDAIARRADVVIEAVIVATVAGALPAYLGIPQDSAAWYFLNVGQWFALPVLLSRLSPEDFRTLKDRVADQKLAGAIIVVSVFFVADHLMASLTPTFQRSMGELLRAAERQGGEFLHGRNATRYFSDSLRAERTLFGSDFRAALSNSTGSRLIAEIRRVAKPPRVDLAVFIPPENEAFWKFQADCRDKHNVQVSLSGEPSLLGVPPKQYGCPRDAYQTNYGEHADSRPLADGELCAHARARNIREVLVLEDVRSSGRNRLLDCAKEP